MLAGVISKLDNCEFDKIFYPNVIAIMEPKFMKSFPLNTCLSRMILQEFHLANILWFVTTYIHTSAIYNL